MAALLREKYAALQIDLTIAIGPQALDFLIQHRASLFPGTPLIFAGVSAARLERRSVPPDITGVVSRFDPVQTLELALRLEPDARQVVVVTGASTFDQSWEAMARERFRPYADRLQVTYLSRLPVPELLRDLARLPRNAIVIYLTVFQDGTGERFVPRDSRQGFPMLPLRRSMASMRLTSVRASSAATWTVSRRSDGRPPALACTS
jgi:hypothetical protein